MSSRWNNYELEILKSQYKDITLKDLSNRLNRTDKSIWKKAKELGLTNTINKKGWSFEEVRFLINNYNLGYNELCKRLARSYCSVRVKCNKLGLKSREAKNIPKNKNYLNLSAEKAYLLGALCGDGYVAKMSKNSQYIIRLAVKDKDFALEFKNCLFNVYGIDKELKVRKEKNGFSWYISIGSKSIYEDLTRYTNFGCYKWDIPLDILESKDVKIKISFLKGIYDAEGSVNEEQISFSSKNKKALSSVKNLLMSFKIKTHINGFNLVIYRLNYRKKFCDMVGFSIKRKQERLEKSLERYRKKLENYKLVKFLNKQYGFGYYKLNRYLGIPKSTIKGWINNKNTSWRCLL